MITKFCLAALLTLSFVSFAQADDLISTPFARALTPVQRWEMADQTVPVPGDIREPLGGITLAGKPAASQASAKIGVAQLNVDAKGRFGKTYRSIIKDGAVGSEIALPAGKYLVQYSGTSQIVDLAAGEHKIISLVKLEIPKVDGSYKVEIFWDLTNGDQQDLFALIAWMLPPKDLSFHYETRDCWGHIIRSWSESESVSNLCRAASRLLTDTRKYCAAYRGSDYKAFGEAFGKFNPDGSYSTLSQVWTRGAGGSPVYVSREFFENGGVLDAAAGHDGEDFALLPGAYGVKMTNASGQSTTKLGVVLR